MRRPSAGGVRTGKIANQSTSELGGALFRDPDDMRGRVNTPGFEASALSRVARGALRIRSQRYERPNRLHLGDILDLDRITASRLDAVGASRDGHRSMRVRHHAACHRRRFDGTRER